MTCTEGGAECDGVRTRVAGGSVEIDEQGGGGGDEETIVTVRFKCTKSE